MKSLNTKLILSALGIAMLATPALAQRPHQKAAHTVQVQVKAPDNVIDEFGTDPDPQIRSELARDAGQSVGGY